VSTISDLEVLVQDRLEEVRDGVGVFWSVKNEIRPLLVEAFNEATLISGLPQVRSGVPFTLTPNTRLFTLPSPAFALARMDGPGTIEKTSFWALDQDDYRWEEEGEPGDSLYSSGLYGSGLYGMGAGTGSNPLKWFPFGIGQFGIFPILNAEYNVFLTTINLPVPVSRPYTGAETVPFSLEFLEGLVNSASAVARLKEGGRDMVEGLKFYEMFLTRMVELSKFGDRISKLRFTRSVGVPAQQSDTEIR
jgi:hypothetical protein